MIDSVFRFWSASEPHLGFRICLCGVIYRTFAGETCGVPRRVCVGVAWPENPRVCARKSNRRNTADSYTQFRADNGDTVTAAEMYIFSEPQAVSFESYSMRSWRVLPYWWCFSITNTHTPTPTPTLTRHTPPEQLYIRMDCVYRLLLQQTRNQHDDISSG